MEINIAKDFRLENGNKITAESKFWNRKRTTANTINNDKLRDERSTNTSLRNFIKAVIKGGMSRKFQKIWGKALTKLIILMLEEKGEAPRNYVAKEGCMGKNVMMRNKK